MKLSNEKFFFSFLSPQHFYDEIRMNLWPTLATPSFRSLFPIRGRIDALQQRRHEETMRS